MALTKEDRKKNALIGNIERSLNAIKEAGKEADFYESISKVEFEQKTIEERFSIVKNYRESNGIKLIREVSPLRKAEDALLLDNTDLSIEEQKKWLFEQFNKVSK